MDCVRYERGNVIFGIEVGTEIGVRRANQLLEAGTATTVRAVTSSDVTFAHTC